MFLRLVLLGLLRIFFYLWGDYMKVLIYLEIVRLIFIIVIIFGLKLDFFSLNFFFSCLIFLVCESRMGFLLFIYYIRIESEVVKKLILVQC
jgi:hypothetical protein